MESHVLEQACKINQYKTLSLMWVYLEEVLICAVHIDTFVLVYEYFPNNSYSRAILM